MKKIFALAMAAVMALSMTACGQKDDASGSAGDLKVGAIYINSKNDTAGYTYAHHNGITTAMKELGLEDRKSVV